MAACKPHLTKAEIWRMCGRKTRFSARLANAFIEKRELEGCRDELRKHECPFCD
ncbi:MAG: hypothetical protein ACLQBD_26735 [Syntrophobacteraceae bacterium]